MPELPEVETVRLGLQEFLPDQTIKSITKDWPKSLPVSDELIKFRTKARKANNYAPQQRL
jgi:formamidopyrimidine-DNA glycosylase